MPSGRMSSASRKPRMRAAGLRNCALRFGARADNLADLGGGLASPCRVVLRAGSLLAGLTPRRGFAPLVSLLAETTALRATQPTPIHVRPMYVCEFSEEKVSWCGRRASGRL